MCPLSGVGGFEVGEEFLLEAGEEFGAADFAVADIVEGFVKVAQVHAESAREDADGLAQVGCAAIETVEEVKAVDEFDQGRFGGRPGKG